MSGPGWYCDGCGDYRCHDGHESYSVAQRDLRTRAEAAEARLAEAREVLRSVEWAAGDMFDDDYCVICKRLRVEGHTADCRLRACLPEEPQKNRTK